ncbi:beta-1,4-N-acetylgalactosaminyltransferase bre-4-like [Epargyreus clarus]|uniref:beta-1,4-N-acetylgalactosaminyltransferase bre-4-like n=1 Tax=Epargyreus clarus TaxID=520877 RepID=UPI003C308CF4
MKQKLEYRIFVVEQYGTDTFNKGRLFNAGFKEMKKYGAWGCIVFHDLDLIPLDERILYSCPSWPRHMCGTVVEKADDPTYHSLFGGVTSMTPAQYEKLNGYSNLYWGWGGEDHDMFWRLRFLGFPITRYNRAIARYTSLPHPISLRNPLRYNHIRGGIGKYRQDGLTTLEYKLISITERHLYTHIVVDINPFNERTTQ